MTARTDKRAPNNAAPQKPGKGDEAAEELLREQAKTETEERPYLDTEGGE